MNIKIRIFLNKRHLTHVNKVSGDDFVCYIAKYFISLKSIFVEGTVSHVCLIGDSPLMNIPQASQTGIPSRWRCVTSDL